MIKGIKKFIPLIILLVVFGCENSDYLRTKDGLIYRIIRGEGGDTIKPGTFLKLHQSLELGDSLFYSTFERMPAFGLFDTTSGETHDFLDILDQMRVGDSAIVIRSVDTLAKRGIIQYNEVFQKGAKLKVKLKILKVFPSMDDMQAERTADFEAIKKEDAESLKKWIANQAYSGLNTLPEGVIIKTEKEGTGIAIDSGMYVSVNYTGMLLDGTIFDSNVDPNFENKEPFKFMVGFQQVIEGWDLAVRQMKVGEKAKVFIPSMLAYGMQGAAPKIPPYSHLIFEIEIVKASMKEEE